MARTKWRVVGISEHRQSGQFQEGLRRMPDFLDGLANGHSARAVYSMPSQMPAF
jgi:hypothetical protein